MGSTKALAGAALVAVPVPVIIEAPVAPPAVVDAVKQYPAQALRRREQGTIEVRVSLNARGEIVTIEAAQAEPRLLVQAALEAVRKAAPYPPST